MSPRDPGPAGGHEYEFPPAALFSTIAICPWRERSPRVDGSLGDWSEDEMMPPLGELSGAEQYAELSLAWNDRGLYLALEVPKRDRIVTNRQTPSSADSLELFIDTRAARTSHRATQFCYHLWILPIPPGERSGETVIWQEPIRRRMQPSPRPNFGSIRLASGIDDEGYVLELAFEPASLHGLDTSDDWEIAMAAVVHDIQRGRQYWGTSSDVPYERDPSTWGVVRPGPSAGQSE